MLYIHITVSNTLCLIIIIITVNTAEDASIRYNNRQDISNNITLKPKPENKAIKVYHRKRFKSRVND